MSKILYWTISIRYSLYIRAKRINSACLYRRQSVKKPNGGIADSMYYISSGLLYIFSQLYKSDAFITYKMNVLFCCNTNPIIDNNYLFISSMLTISQQFMFFLIAAYFKFDKVTDFAGATNFITIALSTMIMGGKYYTRQLLVTISCCIWGIRLSCYLFKRIIRIKKDIRFDNLSRGFTIQYAVFWIIQAFWVFIVSSPITLLNSQCCNDVILNIRDIFGISLFFIGFVIESISDIQKYNFRNNPDNNGKFCNKGFWSLSRHPNYFGEITLWWGFFITSSNVFTNDMYWVLLSPITVTILILFVSGINILEASSNERYGMLDEYKEYKKNVSILIPLPQFLYSRMPNIVKKTIFLDFPIYNN